jgi:hypothetical protein
MFARGFLCFHPTPLPASRQTSPKSNDSPTYAPLRCKSNDSPTYAKTGGWGLFPALTFKYHLKCRRADIFDFSPDFSHFFPSAPQLRLHPAPKEKQEGWPRRSNRGAKDAHKSQRYIGECGRKADPPYAKGVKLLIDIPDRWGILGCCKAQSLIWREHLSGEAA